MAPNAAQLVGRRCKEHTHDIDTYFTTPQGGITFVVERTGGGLCGFIEVSLRHYAEGCQTSPVAYIEGWYVDEERRRGKLGTRLVQAAEAWARRHGLKEMDIGPLTVESHPKQEDVQCLDDRLYEYNASQTGVDDGPWLAVFVRDDQQRRGNG